MAWQRAGLALLLCVPVTVPALAHPALWVARDSNTTVYLFGTVHLMPKGVHWRFPALDKALTASQTLYVEATNVNEAHMNALARRYGMDFSQSLSSRLSPSENALLEKVATQGDIPGGIRTLEVMKPWLAAITLSMAPLRKAGFNPRYGVGRQLQAQMKKAGKQVRALGTATHQVLILADLPEPVQLRLLRESLRDYAHATSKFKAILTAWNNGDVKTLARITTCQMKVGSPMLYQRLLANRSRAWAHKIATLMKTTPGTIFIAVGAAHLAGPGRVQLDLAKLGITTTRVDELPHAAAISN